MSRAQIHQRGKPPQTHLKVSVLNNCRGLRVDRKLLIKTARFVARRHNITTGQIELTIFADADMAEIHKQYLGRRAVTDVICFDLAEDGQNQPAGASHIQASLALGGEVARRQARIHRTSISKELALYAVHGLLHVLGYDDAEEKNSRRMHRREDELLAELGLGAVFHGHESSD